MFERKEVEVREQPPRAVEPEVVEKTIYVKDRQPRFVLGFILGAMLLAGGVTLFANQEGSYQSAGVAADEAVIEAHEQARQVSGDIQLSMNSAPASQNP